MEERKIYFQISTFNKYIANENALKYNALNNLEKNIH